MNRFPSKALLFFGAVLLLGLGLAALAAEEGSGTTETVEQVDPKNVASVTVTGKNYCVGCALKKLGAKAQCSVTGHGHALKVAGAKDDTGKSIPEMKGWTLHYLSNQEGKKLRESRHGETITITGTVFKQERVLDVAQVILAKPPVASGSGTRTKLPVASGSGTK